jgi:hypothetical protein
MQDNNGAALYAGVDGGARGGPAARSEFPREGSACSQRDERLQARLASAATGRSPAGVEASADISAVTAVSAVRLTISLTLE